MKELTHTDYSARYERWRGREVGTVASGRKKISSRGHAYIGEVVGYSLGFPDSDCRRSHRVCDRHAPDALGGPAGAAGSCGFGFALT